MGGAEAGRTERRRSGPRYLLWRPQLQHRPKAAHMSGQGHPEEQSLARSR